MTTAYEVEALFADARSLHESALRQMDQGDIRDAAEKAWCATKRATDALLLSRTGEDSAVTAGTSDGLDLLAQQDSSVKVLVGRYYSRIHQLHGKCFYEGNCAGETIRRIRETDLYIHDAERLALG